jgi:putative ubiquitin-RnfH superfamily antitoxin RatB of RatAB toxin-antitoxin module
MAHAEGMRISVAFSPRAGEVDETTLELPAGATLIEAVHASGLLQRHPGIDLGVLRTGIWGRLKPLDAPLRERDRVEIYRPLLVDPKEARRLRYRKDRRSSR